jgi:hypothetical protein
VAEGLQDRAAEAILIESGCDGAQGFLIGRPMDESEITPMLLDHFGIAKLETAPESAGDGASGELAATAEQGHSVDLETA